MECVDFMGSVERDGLGRRKVTTAEWKSESRGEQKNFKRGLVRGRSSRWQVNGRSSATSRTL